MNEQLNQIVTDTNWMSADAENNNLLGPECGRGAIAVAINAIEAPIEVPTQVEAARPPVEATETPKTLEEYAKAILEAHQISKEADGLSKIKGKEAIAAGLKAGQYLIEVKELVGHGKWQKWVEKNCKGINIKTAQRYMTLARFKNDTVSFLDECSSLRQAYICSGALAPTKADLPPENQEKDGDDEEAPKTHEIILADMQRGFEKIQNQYDILTQVDPELDGFLLGKGYSNDLPLLLQQWPSSLSDAFAYFGLPPISNECARCGHVREWYELFVPIPPYYHLQHQQRVNQWCQKCEASYDEKTFPDFPKAVKELTDNLNELKSMSVKEYTLAQKLYQLKEIAVPEPDVIAAAENNVWVLADINNEEQTIATIQRLSPKIVIAKDKPTKNLWDIYRHFVSSAVYYPTPGRWIRFLVVDESQASEPVLGIGAISGDFPALARRDEFIGWSKELREKKQKEGGKLGHTANASTIVPTQILGSNFLGGKLIAALTTNQTIRDEWQSQYKDILVGMTTTSLFGIPSMYNGVKQWKCLGQTTGKVPVQPKLEIYKNWLEFLKETRTHEFQQMMTQDDDVSGPVTNYKTKVLTMIYKAAGLNLADFMHGHERGIYFSEFYENSRDFLCGKIQKGDLRMKPLFQETIEQITERWRKQAIKRYLELKQNGKLKTQKRSFSQLAKMDFQAAQGAFSDDTVGDVED
jgi:Domain of unknown function (DUF4338)/Protein of unknown function (DUF3102)